MKTSTARALAAGTVGTLAVDVVTWSMYRQQSSESLEREGQLRTFGMDTAHALARRVTKALGSDAASHQPNAAGVVHYGMGMLPAVVYAAQRGKHPGLRRARGALYGVGLYVVNDLVATRLLRIAAPQTAYPWQAHARGVVGHVVLGMTHRSRPELHRGLTAPHRPALRPLEPCRAGPAGGHGRRPGSTRVLAPPPTGGDIAQGGPGGGPSRPPGPPWKSSG